MAIGQETVSQTDLNLKAMVDAYNHDADSEWRRLVKEPYNKIEFLTTLHVLRKHLPEKGLILDAGGGPGRYAIELCKAEYHVVLFDLSIRNIETAKAKFDFEPKEVKRRMEGFLVGDVRNLIRFEIDSFDAVLCLDPLSNLLDEAERERAVQELYRVAKPGAPVFIGVRGYLAVLRTLLAQNPHELLGASLTELQQTGNIQSGPNVCHYFRATELRTLAERNGFQTVEMAGCIGLSVGMREKINQLSHTAEQWERWLALELEYATEAAVADTAERLLYVGRKPR